MVRNKGSITLEVEPIPTIQKRFLPHGPTGEKAKNLFLRRHNMTSQVPFMMNQEEFILERTDVETSKEKRKRTQRQD